GAGWRGWAAADGARVPERVASPAGRGDEVEEEEAARADPIPDLSEEPVEPVILRAHVCDDVVDRRHEVEGRRRAETVERPAHPGRQSIRAARPRRHVPLEDTLVE